jgi:hypothetical protein
MPRPTSGGDDESAALRGRAELILATFEREEPSPTWARYRELIAQATRLTHLRGINQDLRAMMVGLPRASGEALKLELRARFGPDREEERDRLTVAKIRARGRIQSEREYRIVQQYADSIPANPDDQEEFLTLGAMLDAYMAAPELPNDR